MLLCDIDLFLLFCTLFLFPLFLRRAEVCLDEESPRPPVTSKVKPPLKKLKIKYNRKTNATPGTVMFVTVIFKKLFILQN